MTSFVLRMVVSGLVLASGTAAAQPAAVVMDFEGRGAGRARSAAVAAVEDRLALMSEDDFASAASEAGVDLSTSEGVAEVADSEDLAIVVTGRVRGRGNRARATVRFLGRDGSELSVAQARAPRNRSTRRRFASAVTRALEEALAAIGASVPAESDEEEEEEEEDGEDEEEDEDEEDGEDEEEEEEEEDGEDEEEDEDEERASDDSAERTHPYVRLLVGVDGRTRNADINLDDGLKRSYSAIFPQLTVAAEGRPLAGMGGMAAGLIVMADFSVGLALSSSEELVSGGTEVVETSTFRFSALLGYLFDLSVLELGATVGFTYDTFQLEPNNTMPTATYPALRAAAIVRVPIVDELLGLFVDGGVRFILGTDDLTPTFGEASSALGFDVVGGVFGALDVGFTYAARFGYVGTFLDFQGDGTLVEDTATDGLDGGFYFGGQLGWQL